MITVPNWLPILFIIIGLSAIVSGFIKRGKHSNKAFFGGAVLINLVLLIWFSRAFKLL